MSEAASRLEQQGQAVRTIALRLLSPLCTDKLVNALDGCSRVIVIEQNHGGQLYHHLLGHCHHTLESLALPGPVPLDPAAIVHAVAGRVAA